MARPAYRPAEQASKGTGRLVGVRLQVPGRTLRPRPDRITGRAGAPAPSPLGRPHLRRKRYGLASAAPLRLRPNQPGVRAVPSQTRDGRAIAARVPRSRGTFDRLLLRKLSPTRTEGRTRRDNTPRLGLQ